MPLIHSIADELPYIDVQPSDSALANARSLIEAETGQTSELHPSLPALRKTSLSPTLEAELQRLEAGQPKEGGIDLSRYDVLDAPEKGDLKAWQAVLQQAHASSEYLRDRELNLALLETYGKNAWLISNSQLEDILRDLERQLEAAKTDLESVEQARRNQQANAAGEVQSLQDTWKTGIGRMIEAQVAGEQLRQHILDRRRQGIS